MKSTSGHLKRGVASIGYTVYAGEQPGRPLVFCHGYAMRSSGSIYRRLFEALVEEFTVYALDLRGHGASAEAVVNWSLEAIADDAAALAEELGLERPVFAGHSIGGFIGLLTAIRRPGLFSAFCLLTTAPAAGGAYNPAETAGALTEGGRDPPAMRTLFSGMYVWPDPAELEEAVASVGIMRPEVHHRFFSTFPDYVLTARLGEISTPVLLVNGQRDVVVPPDEQHATAVGLSASKEIVFSREGHMLPIESPHLAAREILNFCRYDLTDAFGQRPADEDRARAAI